MLPASMSSPDLASDQHVAAMPASSPSTRVAFLVHSVHTLTENLPPEVDDKSLARQRRRRTSPEDQKILEDEFRKDPRPGKAVRKDIVSRVSLGDKEVQIWFQNRRQNTRRKSKHDGSEVPSSEDMPESAQSSSPLHVVAEDAKDVQIEEAAIVNDSVPRKEDQQRQEITTATTVTMTNDVSTATSAQTTTKLDDLFQDCSSSQGALAPSSSQQSNKSGYIANRRINSTYADDLDLLPQPRKPLRRFATTHDFRLSMTDDGAAKVVDRSMKSVSPAKPRATAVENAIVCRLGSLRRSRSAAGLDASNATPAAAEPTVRKLARTSTLGRSRDSRTWEFWCDSDARSSLQARAAQETSGSAVEAIGLIRSNSSRALKLNTSKMNSPNPSHHRSRDGGKHSRPPMQRAKTHVGFVKPTKPSSNQIDIFEDQDFEHLNPESDKENAEPVSKLNLSRVGGKKVLVDSVSAANSLAPKVKTTSKSRKHRVSKSVEIHVDSEVSAFMSHARSSSAAGDELDCVQSLLSLSQGNWSRS